MKQPGIEVRPLRQMTGAADFNEVFFSDARTPADWIVGKRGEGWIVSRTTLKHERNMIGDAANTVMMFEGLVALAKRTHARRPARDRRSRRSASASSQLEGYVRSHQYSGYRQLTKAAKAQEPGRIGLMNKLVSTNLGQEMAKIALDLVGDDGLLEPAERTARRAARERPVDRPVHVVARLGGRRRHGQHPAQRDRRARARPAARRRGAAELAP